MRKRHHPIHPPRSPFDFKDAALWIFMVMCILFLSLIIFGCSPVKDINDSMGLSPDNWVEESIEFVLDKALDIDVDLTGDSQE